MRGMCTPNLSRAHPMEHGSSEIRYQRMQQYRVTEILDNSFLNTSRHKPDISLLSNGHELLQKDFEIGAHWKGS